MRKAAAFTLACIFLSLLGCSGGQSAKGVVHNGLYVDQSGVPICPVTGDQVAVGEEVGKTVYKGVEYHFCCPGCPEQFGADPKKYAVR